MKLMTKTYGVMPTREEFEWLWETTDANGELRDGKFHFGNCKRMGNRAFNEIELWNELQKAYKEAFEDPSTEFEFEAAESTGDWISCVLGYLGLEWI